MRYGTGVAMVALAATLWSFMATGVRLVGEAEVWTVLFWRSLGMVPVLAALILWRAGGLWRPLRAQGVSGIVGALGLIAAFGGAIHAIQTLPVANAVFLFSASPFLAAILGRVVLGERLRPATMLAILVALAGIAIMIRGGEFDPGAVIGNLSALASALGFAVFSVALRAGRAADTAPTALLGALLSILLAAGAAGASGQGLSLPLPQAATAVALGLILLGGGMALYTFGSRVVPAAELTLVSQIEVMLAPVWGWVILSEVPEPQVLAGGAVILVAVLLNAGTGFRRARPA